MALETQPILEVEATAPADVGADTRAVRRRRSPALVLAVSWLGLLVLLALIADLLPLNGYDQLTGTPNLRPFREWSELLGTDTLGRSMLSRAVYGARVSLFFGVVTVALATVVGGTMGLVAGYFRGRVDSVLNIVVDSALAIPGLALIVALAAFLEPSLRTLTIAVTVLLVPVFARLARANTMSVATREYVLAARAQGSGHVRLIAREVLPNMILPVLSFAVIVVAIAIVAEGSLSFLGLGVPPPTPSWGGMIAGGRSTLDDAPHNVFVPSAVLFLTVLSINTLGERVRERIDSAS